MPPLQWPPAPLKIQRGASGKLEVMCLARRKWVALEPEEWVRQHVIHHCIDVLNYPAGCIAVERPLVLNGMNRRADIVCHTTDGQAQLLVECKAPEVKLSQDAVSQVARYNMVLKVPAMLGDQRPGTRGVPDRPRRHRHPLGGPPSVSGRLTKEVDLPLRTFATNEDL